MSNPVDSILNTPRESTMKEIAAALNALVAVQSGVRGAVTDWLTYQVILRNGVAERQFPLGTKLGITHSVYGAFNYIVAGYNVYPDPHNRFQHSALLVPDIAIVNSLQYDASEALYYCVDGLAAGTYHFTLLPGYDVANGGGATYQFTLTQPVPAGGQICFPWTGKAPDTKVSTYASRTSTTVIETVGVTVGTGGTDLGTADGKTTNMNHTHRIRYGSSNWKESAIRQFLNSRAEAGRVWQPQTIFDRPPSWAATTVGWMAGLPDDFLAVVGDTDVTTRTNSVFEANDALNSSYVLPTI